ncbi:MAG: chorismate mutase, partial [Bacteroidia bacterium]
EYKKQNNVTILQANYWEGLLNERINTASKIGLNGDFIRAIYTLIHEESIRKQTVIMNSNEVFGAK